MKKYDVEDVILFKIIYDWPIILIIKNLKLLY